MSHIHTCSMTSHYGEDTCQQRFFNIDLHWQSCIFALSHFYHNPVWLIAEPSNLRFTIPRIRQPISLASLTPDSRSVSPRIQTILRLNSNFAVSKRFAFCCEIAKAILLDGLLTQLLGLLIVVAVYNWCYVLLLYPLALDVKTLETRRSLVFDGIDIDANGKHCRLKVADEPICTRC